MQLDRMLCFGINAWFLTFFCYFSVSQLGLLDKNFLLLKTFKNSCVELLFQESFFSGPFVNVFFFVLFAICFSTVVNPVFFVCSSVVTQAV